MPQKLKKIPILPELWEFLELFFGKTNYFALQGFFIDILSPREKINKINGGS
jgi:hypothetical protein